MRTALMDVRKIMLRNTLKQIERKKLIFFICLFPFLPWGGILWVLKKHVTSLNGGEKPTKSKAYGARSQSLSLHKFYKTYQG